MSYAPYYDDTLVLSFEPTEDPHREGSHRNHHMNGIGSWHHERSFSYDSGPWPHSDFGPQNSISTNSPEQMASLTYNDPTLYHDPSYEACNHQGGDHILFSERVYEIDEAHQSNSPWDLYTHAATEGQKTLNGPLQPWFSEPQSSRLEHLGTEQPFETHSYSEANEDTSQIYATADEFGYLQPQPKSFRAHEVPPRHPDLTGSSVFQHRSTSSGVFRSIESSGPGHSMNVDADSSRCYSVSTNMTSLDSDLRLTYSNPPSPTSSSISATFQSALTILFCDQCAAEFVGRYRRGNLMRHKRNKHPGIEYPCSVPYCSKTFRRSDARQKHMYRHHPEITSEETYSNGPMQSTYTCNEPGCGREFERNADLIRHQRTHLSESERPYKCPHCDQSFLYPKDLRRHEATHVEICSEPIHCQVSSCAYGPGGLSFTRRDGLLRHERRAHAPL